MSFRTEINRFAQQRVVAAGQRVHNRAVELLHESIVEGSALTGAPGQPVAPNAPPGVPTLKASWQRRDDGPLVSTVSTDVDYAPDIEDGTRDGRALVLRSKTGGWHSVKLTIAGWGRIVAQAVKDVTGA